MNREFVSMAEKIVNERGKDLFHNTKLTRAIFMDCGRGEYKNEINLLTKTLELGYVNKIINDADLQIAKMTLSKQLKEDHFINEEMAHSIVLLLIGLLRDRSYLKEIAGDEEKQIIDIDAAKYVETEPVFENSQKEENVIEKNHTNNKWLTGIWVCNECYQTNKETSMVCKGCGSYKPSPGQAGDIFFAPTVVLIGIILFIVICAGIYQRSHNNISSYVEQQVTTYGSSDYTKIAHALQRGCSVAELQSLIDETDLTQAQGAILHRLTPETEWSQFASRHPQYKGVEGKKKLVEDIKRGVIK